jgi:CubicO group peptidase (beta-lactamase class C family)
MSHAFPTRRSHSLLRRARASVAVAALVALASPLAAQPSRAPIARAPNGFSAERLARIDRFLQQYVDSNRIGGAVALVLRDGQVAYQKSVGWIDRESRRPMTTDAMFRIASQSKAITSTAVLMLVEEGGSRSAIRSAASSPPTRARQSRPAPTAVAPSFRHGARSPSRIC